MKLSNLFSWKTLRNKYLISTSLFFLFIYTALSYSDLSYFVLGTMLRRPLEPKSEYLIRSILFLSREHKHNPEEYREYVDELVSLEWDDVREELISRYIQTSPFIGSRSMFSTRSMILLWPKVVKADCENIMKNQEHHKTYNKKEYLNILYLHLLICTNTWKDHQELASKQEATKTCEKIKSILKGEKYTDDHFINSMRLVVDSYCPDS